LGLANTSTKVHAPGTVFLGMIGEGKTRGQAAILDITACHNQNSAAIRVAETPIPSEYIYHYLRFVYEITRRVGSGNNQPALNKSRVQAMTFPLAPLEEQLRISEVISAMLAGATEINEVAEFLKKEPAGHSSFLAIPIVSETKSQFKFDFFETNAPKGIAKDVTNLGLWQSSEDSFIF